jgi:ribosomal protein S19
MGADRRGEKRDRRIIERFSDSRVRQGMMQIRFWVRIVVGILATLMMVRLVFGVYSGVKHLPAALFDATILAIFIAQFWYYLHSIGIYLTNESVNNFEKTVDRQRSIWMVFCILTILYLIISVALKI